MANIMASFPLDVLVALAKETLRDRIIGCLIGSALGDAIGLYTEFLSGEQSAKAYPSRSFRLHPRSQATPFRRDSHRDPNVEGDWTDDTDHAMLLLLSYLHSDGEEVNPKDFARRLDIWVRMGLRALETLPLGLGMTTASVVRSKGYLEDPDGTAREHWRKGGFNAAPNGSLMRTHPVGLFCVGKSIEETFCMAADVSAVTHADPRCIISCAIGSALVRGLVRGEVRTEQDIDDMVDKAITWYASSRHAKGEGDEPGLDVAELRRHAARTTDLADMELDDARKMGYVYKTLGSGLCLLRMAMRGTAAFEPLIVDLIMRGGDADTNACFAGALLGAYLGSKALPGHWRNGLTHGEWLMGKAEGLCDILLEGGGYVGSQDKDTRLDGGRGFLTEKQVEERFMILQAEMARRGRERREREKAARKGNRGLRREI